MEHLVDTCARVRQSPRRSARPRLVQRAPQNLRSARLPCLPRYRGGSTSILAGGNLFSSKVVLLKFRPSTLEEKRFELSFEIAQHRLCQLSLLLHHALATPALRTHRTCAALTPNSRRVSPRTNAPRSCRAHAAPAPQCHARRAFCSAPSGPRRQTPRRRMRWCIVW